jgi:hypothetical protein
VLCSRESRKWKCGKDWSLERVQYAHSRPKSPKGCGGIIEGLSCRKLTRPRGPVGRAPWAVGDRLPAGLALALEFWEQGGATGAPRRAFRALYLKAAAALCLFPGRNPTSISVGPANSNNFEPFDLLR